MPHLALPVLALPTLALAASLLLGGGAAAANGCVQIGPSIFCGTEGAHNIVGRNAIFRSGPPGEIVGGFLFLDRPGALRLVQPLVGGSFSAAPLDPMPQARPPGDYIDLQRGKDFGAFEFPFENPRGGSVAGSRAGRLGPSLPAFQRR